MPELDIERPPNRVCPHLVIDILALINTNMILQPLRLLCINDHDFLDVPNIIVHSTEKVTCN